MNKAATLILTATIAPPPGVPNLKRISPQQRRLDYLDALRFYLGLSSDVIGHIVFLENSGSDLADLQQLAETRGQGKEVEFISFHGLDYPPAYGRAYGEFRMLDYGFAHSSHLLSITDHEFVWKITGRLKVYNLPAIIAKAPSTYALLMDFLRRPTQMVDLRLLSCSRAGYRQLFEGLYATLREDALKMSAESYLYQLWVDHLPELGIVPRHLLQPKIGGIGGQHNENYYAGINVSKYWIRSLARHCTPNLWI